MEKPIVILKATYPILKVGLPMSKFQVDPTKKWTSDLDSPKTVMPKYKRACSVKVWCTKVARILRIVVQTGANLAV